MKFLVLFASMCSATHGLHATKPHIVFLLSDDLGNFNIGYKNPAVYTPTLDLLAHEGVRLNRHYVYKFCSPTRSSLLSGRLPVHVNELNRITEAPRAGIPANMTTLPEQLKKAGYRTHHIGKWHAGFASKSNILINRGFDSSLAYFHGQEDHYTQSTGGNVKCRGQPQFKDFWLNDGPAVDLVGINYSAHIYRDFALDIIDKHDTSVPLFLFMAFANNHEPLQVPEEYTWPYPNKTAPSQDWRVYQSMITAVDYVVANVTNRLRQRGMYENTLVVWTSDNGGPIYSGGGGNNHPLRGGKVTDWEGGFRVPAFVSGGALPLAARNTSWDGVVHIADWYRTFCTVAGLPAKSCQDERATTAALPGLDSIDMWNAITTAGASPRKGKPMLLSSYASDPAISFGLNSSTLLVDNWKIIVGTTVLGVWTGPSFPNASGYPRLLPSVVRCGQGCLFDVEVDPGEHNDLSAEQPAKLAELQQMVRRESKLVYNPDRGQPGNAPCLAAEANGGFWAPYLA